MSVFSESAKNDMLDALTATLDACSLHTGDPGAAGTANEVDNTGNDYVRLNPSFSAASGGEAALSAPLDFAGPGDGTVTWFAVWATGVFKGKGQITTGDTTFNAAGEFRLTTNTKLVLQDPV